MTPYVLTDNYPRPDEQGRYQENKTKIERLTEHLRDRRDKLHKETKDHQSTKDTAGKHQLNYINYQFLFYVSLVVRDE